jgi:hypothetical protein
MPSQAGCAASEIASSGNGPSACADWLDDCDGVHVGGPEAGVPAGQQTVIERLAVGGAG